MRKEEFFEVLGELDDDIVRRAEASIKENTNSKVRRFGWLKWGALAAGLTIVLFTTGVFTGVIPLLGGNTGNEGGNSPGSGSSTFMSYAGPVFPLTLRDADSDLTAQREITLDFAPWIPVMEDGYQRYSNNILVTDAYVLTNTSEKEKTVSVLYPFSGAIYNLTECKPTLTADGTELNTVLHAGGYSGGFQGAYGGSGEQMLNLDQLNSWEEYKALLSDRRYQTAALEEYPDLSEVSVTVYRFFDYYGPERDEKAGYPNPSIRAEFELDYDNTTVLSYGFHAASYDRENRRMIQGFSIPEPFNPWYGNSYYLIVVGDDIRNLTTGAYVTGGTDAGTKELDNAGVSVERYTSDLETALRTAAELMYSGNERIQESGAEFEMYFGLLKEFMYAYGVLSNEPVERYHSGWLEELDVVSVNRVFYLEAEITIPAGGSVQLTAKMTKQGSYDFYCTHTENQGVYGYDLVTELGSNLSCTDQRATIKDRGLIEIVRQNFGFDLENGIRTVDLDSMQEHYYLEVRSSKK